MADKFIRDGATYCGDGTTSAAAASNGAAGAWNNINVLTGSAPAYGSLAAGDTVYLRSKNNSGADITISPGASFSIGSSSATSTAWITWVLDHGTVWSGISGTLTFSYSASYVASWLDNNRFISTVDERFVISATNAFGSYSTYWAFDNAHLRGWLISLPNYTGGWMRAYNAVLENCHINLYRLWDSALFYTNVSGGPTLVNVQIEAAASLNPAILFYCDSAVYKMTIRGGRAFGAGMTSNVNVTTFPNNQTAAANIDAIGFQVPKTVGMYSGTPTIYPGQFLNMRGMDGGFGSSFAAAWGLADSRNIDNYYPVLNATEPTNAAAGWSWRVYPKAASDRYPVDLPIAKAYALTAATKTVTLEFLLANPWGGSVTPTAREVWMEVSYIDDSTGLPKYITTRDHTGAALTSSTAAWSATTWGAVAFNKRKLAITTPTAIKQDTMVLVSFKTSIKSASNVDLLMVCPDVQLT